MALDPKKLSNDIKDLNKIIDQMYKKLGRMDTPPVFKASEVASARREIKKLNEDINDINSSLDFTTKVFRDSLNEITKTNTELGYAKKALRGLSSVAQQLRYENEKGLAVEKETLEKLQKKAKIERDSLKIALDSKRITGDKAKELERDLELADKFLATMEKVAEQTEKIKNNVGVKTFSFFEEFTSSIPGLKAFSGPFKEAREEAERTAKTNMDLAGQTESLSKKQIKALKKIEEFKSKSKTQDLSKEALRKGKGRKIGDVRKGGGLDRDMMAKIAKEGGIEDLVMGKDGKMLAGKSAQKRASKVLAGNDLAKSITGGKSPLRAGMTKLFKSMGKMLKGVLKKALGPAALFLELKEAILGLDKAAADMAKQFGMTYDDALQMNKEFTQMASASGEIMVNTKGIRETFIAINSALGTNSQLSEEMAVSFTKLREMSGFTNEELNGLHRIMAGVTDDALETTGEFMAQAKITAAQLGVRLNEQQIAKDLHKISAATTLSFAKNPKLIAEAVATTKALGMEMSKVENIAEGLLNFEDSIRNELEAELLLNKDINLERARQAALNNDLATVASEIANQIGSAAEFTEMNRIQQDALAKSVNMNREELAATLLLQEQISHLSKEDGKEALRSFELMKQKYGLAEAQRMLEEEGIEQLNNQVGVQEQFNATIEKLKEIFVVVANAIMPLLSALSSIIGLLDPVIQASAMVAAIIQDIIGGIGALFGSGYDFGSATIGQAKAVESSMNKNWGFSAGLFEGEKLKMGGLLTGPTMVSQNAIAGEAGTEAILPLPSDGIKTNNSDVVNAIKTLTEKVQVTTMFQTQ